VAEVTEHEIWVRSTDMDADRIVNNARYFEYFEQGRLEHLRRIGVIVRPRPPGEADRSFTIAETTCRYLAPLRHRDVVTVRAWTSDVRNRSFVLAYELVRRADGTVAAMGSSAQVWLDADGKPAPFPQRVREVLVASLEGGE
jgi:acyl-CoA thioester hydrolase